MVRSVIYSTINIMMVINAHSSPISLVTYLRCVRKGTQLLSVHGLSHFIQLAQFNIIKDRGITTCVFKFFYYSLTCFHYLPCFHNICHVFHNLLKLHYFVCVSNVKPLTLNCLGDKLLLFTAYAHPTKL